MMYMFPCISPLGNPKENNDPFTLQLEVGGLESSFEKYAQV